MVAARSGDFGFGFPPFVKRLAHDGDTFFHRRVGSNGESSTDEDQSA